MNARGMTLLEVMVAIVILGLVVGTYLELFSGSLRSAGAGQTWSQAVAYATDGMERAKLEQGTCQPAAERLPNGFERQCEILPWMSSGVDLGLAAVRVVVTLPGGGQYAVDRLAPFPIPTVR